MSGSPLALALWNLLQLAVLGGLVWLLTWAIFGDRQWRQPRCPRCWHDMTGTTSLVCSECGRAMRDERSLHRRRRRWGIAVLAFAAMMALTLHLRSEWSHRGWASMIPNTVAVALLPWLSADGALRDLHDELANRLGRGWLSVDQTRRVLERIAEGETGARPGTSEWQERFGPLLERWTVSGRAALRIEVGATTSLIDIEAKLARLPPVVTVSPPSSWLAGVAIPFELVVARTGPASEPQRLIVESAIFSAEAMRPLAPMDRPIQLLADGPFSARIPLSLPALPAGEHTGMLSVRVETMTEGAWQRLATIEAPISVQVVEQWPRPSDTKEPWVFEGRSDPVIDEAIRAFAAPGLVRWSSGDRRFAMRFDPASLMAPEIADVAVGVIAELLEDGVVRRRLRIWWAGPRGLRFEPPEEDLEALERANTDDGRWTLRVRGVRELALRPALELPGSGRRSWWSGEVTMPMPMSEPGRVAPPRAWTIGPRTIEQSSPDTEPAAPSTPAVAPRS